MAFVTIIDGNGDEGIGSAFHIGQGIFVTAWHVIEGAKIKGGATTKSALLSEEAGGKTAPPRRLAIVDGPYFNPDDLDVAVFRIDLGDAPLPAITVSQHTDASLGEDELVLSDILVIGYSTRPRRAVSMMVMADMFPHPECADCTASC
ncbi:MAG: trypsin-like peptidase domain-containing protein [Roseovarius sp.]